MDLVEDDGIAVFAGLNVVPKRSYLAAYSSRSMIAIERFMAAWFNETPRAGLTHGTSPILDSFPHGADQQYPRTTGKTLCFPSFRSQQGMLTFLARDGRAAGLCATHHAGIARPSRLTNRPLRRLLQLTPAPPQPSWGVRFEADHLSQLARSMNATSTSSPCGAAHARCWPTSTVGPPPPGSDHAAGV